MAKFAEIKKATQAQQDFTEKCVADFNKGSQDILEQIEIQEHQRLDVLRQGLGVFSAQTLNMIQQHESLHKLIEQEFRNVDPVKDIQLFIAKNSTFTENERLRSLYKEMGLYQPLSEEQSAQAGRPEKTRSMAQQLKQLEEERRRKALAEEQARKTQEQLRKSQAVVNKLKDARELLYKIASQAAGCGSVPVLYAPRPGSTAEFKINGRQTVD